MEKEPEPTSIKFAGFAITDNDLTHYLAKRVRNSFIYFHPDLPFYIFDAKDEERLLGKKLNSGQSLPSASIRVRFAQYLLKTYDGVIYLDVDTIVVSRLNEFLEGDYDIAGSLNIERYAGDTYLNCGVFAVKSRDFCQQWANLIYDSESGLNNIQVAFNYFAKNGHCRLKIVDEKDCYYNERSRPYWKDIVIKDEKLFCNNRQLKVLHWAGGFRSLKKRKKLSYKGFNKEVRMFLNKVGHTRDFIEIEGVERWY
jgi:hypothetical protein